MPLKMTYIEIPTNEQCEDIRKSANVTGKSLKRDVQHLIEWFEKQPHLPNFRDEYILEISLIQSKNSLEKVKMRFEKFFITKALYPEVFHNRNPFEKDMETVKHLALYVPLRKLTPDGYRVVCLYLSDDLSTMSKFPPMDYFFKMTLMTIDLMAQMDYGKGVILVHDAKNVNMSLAQEFSVNIQKMIILLHKSVPIHYTKIYCVNFGTVAETLLSIFNSILKKKIIKRIELLKNPTDISKVLPKEIIPREYGGDELPLSELKDLWYEDIKNNYNYLQSVESLVADMTKVPKDFATSEISEMVGSFRKLSVD